MEIGTVSPSTFVWTIPNVKDWLPNFDTVVSPDFHLPDSSWYLKLAFNRMEWINICIHRRDSGPPKTITYVIKIKGRTDVVVVTNTKLFKHEYDYWIEPTILNKEMVSDSNLLITCYIKCDTPHPVAGRELVTCAVQTEVANSVIENENPKSEDWPSINSKDDALLRERMKELLIKGSDHDVTICVQDKEFRAHRSILSTRSPVFAMMLSHDNKENKTGTISIEDCDPESFDEFLLYVYSGRTENLSPSNAFQLYYAADKYDFPVLKERCVSLLKTSLSVESIYDVVLLATKHQEKELLNVATEFFARNMKKIVITAGWQKFLAQNLVEANELIVKSMEILLPKD